MANKSVEKIINDSGHKLHLKVADLLENEGWEVSISPYYIDDYTDKPREIDIIATKYFVYTSKTDNEQKKFYFVLGIDCKYLTENVVIWGRKNKLGAKALLTNIDNYFTPMMDNQRGWCAYARFPYVGRLISEGGKRPALEDGVLQAVKATLDKSGRFSAPAVFLPAVIYELDKDVQVCVVEDDVTHSTSPSPIKNNWIYHVNYAYRVDGKAKQKQLYVDLVKESALLDYLQMLEKDGKTIADAFNRHSNNKP